MTIKSDTRYWFYEAAIARKDRERHSQQTINDWDWAGLERWCITDDQIDAYISDCTKKLKALAIRYY